MKTAFLIDFKSGGDNKSITVNSQRMIYMKKNKLILASVAALMAVSPVLSFGSQTHTVQAATNSVQKIIMHTAVGYDPDGGNTGIKLYPYKTVNVDATPVLIKGQKYYKVTGKYLYIKPTNIDGVTRKVTRNTYIIRVLLVELHLMVNGSFIKVKLLQLTVVLTNLKIASVTLELTVRKNNTLKPQT